MSDEKEINIIPLYYDYILSKPNYPVVILVGGRNSGKSFFLEQLANTNTHNIKNYKLLVIEDVETNIGAGVKDGIERRADEFGLAAMYKSVKQPPEVAHCYSGSKVIFKGYHSDDQQKQVKSLNEVTAAWYEEAENITYDQFKALRMQLRGGRQEDRQLFLSLNPVISDSFINHYFFEEPPDKVLLSFGDGRPKVFERNISVDMTAQDGKALSVTITCLVIVSTHWDNPYLTAEQRADIEEFKTTDPDKYAMLAEGKFIKPAGTYFKEFSPAIHVCSPFQIPKHWKWYFTMDYGFDMAAFYWIAVDEQMRAYVVKEFCQGKDNGKEPLIISNAAAKIKEYTNEPIAVYLAPPDMWNKRQETGKTVADLFAESRIYLTKTSNERVAGWMAVKEWLRPFKDIDGTTRARLTIFENCRNLIKCIPALQYDDKNPSDAAKLPHEITHSPDALRYFCVYWTTAAQKPYKTGKYTPDLLEDWANADEEIKKIMEERYGAPY